MYKYWGFGMNIASEIAFPELLVHDFEFSDVDFLLGVAPDSIKGATIASKKFSYIVCDQELLFTANDVARYYATNGSKVVIEPFEPIQDMRSVRLYVLATVMAAILMHRGLLPLHASALFNGQGHLALVTGETHAGKSTTLAGLIRKGYSVFSDDVVVLHKKKPVGVEAMASYPMVKLWNDTLEKMNDPLFDDRSFRIQRDLDKFGFFFHNRFDKNRYPINKVFVLRVQPVSGLTHRYLDGKEAFEMLSRQVYRPMLIQNISLRLLCFTLVSDIVKNSNVIEICRPTDCEADDLVEFVEALL